MNHLYYYLLFEKKYSTEKVERTISLLEAGKQLPKDVDKDIDEYLDLWNKANPNTLFDGVEI